MATTPRYVTNEVLERLLEEFKDKMLDLLDSRITTTLSAESTDVSIPTAKAVFDAIEAAGLDVVPVIGPILAVDPSPRTLYMVRDDETDTTCDVCYHTGEEWLRTGGTVEGDKDNFYSKDELTPVTNGDVTTIIDAVFSGDGTDEEDSAPDPEDD